MRLNNKIKLLIEKIESLRLRIGIRLSLVKFIVGTVFISAIVIDKKVAKIKTYFLA